MKIAVVLNGISLERKLFYRKFLPRLNAEFPVEVFETLSKNDAVMLASRATYRYYDVVISAGGDGTIHQVVNGILQGREQTSHLPVVGVLPVGTGNDFARSLGIRPDVEQLIALLRDFKPRKLDVGKIEYSDSPAADSHKSMRYFINVVDTGMGPEVVQKVLRSGRPFGLAVTYYLTILASFLNYKPIVAHVKTGGGNWSSKMRSLAVANGKYFAHGLCVAPEAKLDDGVLEIFACGNASAMDFIMHSIALRRERKIHHPHVYYDKTETAVDLSAEEPCPVEADGELLGWLPARVELLPSKLDFLY